MKTKFKRIACMSWPKAGTHVLLEFARLAIGDGDWLYDPDIKCNGQAKDFFRKLDDRITKHPSSFAFKGHIPWSAEIEQGLLTNGFKLFFIVRDPRDVLGSTMRWLRDLRPNWEVSEILRALPDDPTRLSVIIAGLPKLRSFAQFGIDWHLPLPERYQMLTPWTQSVNCCTVRYESLTGNLGHAAQMIEINRMLAHLDIDSPELSARISQKIVNPNSRTFHTGRSQVWPEDFSPSHRRLFQDLGGEALVSAFSYPPTIGAGPNAAPVPTQLLCQAASKAASPRRKIARMLGELKPMRRELDRRVRKLFTR